MSLYHAADIVSHLSLSLSGFLLRINKLLNYRKEKKRTEKKITDWAALGLHTLSIPQTTEAGWASTQSHGEAAT